MRRLFRVMAAMTILAAASVGASEAGSGFVMPDFKSTVSIADTDKDGVVTRAEFTQARATYFPKCDADNNGSLSKNEFVSVMAQLAGSEFMAGRLFGSVDANGDGALTLEEWNAMPLRAFDKADANKDRRLTPDEIEK